MTRLRGDTVPHTSTRPMAMERMRAVGVFWMSCRTRSVWKPCMNMKGPEASDAVAVTGSQASATSRSSEPRQRAQGIERAREVDQARQRQRRAQGDAERAPDRHPK